MSSSNKKVIGNMELLLIELLILQLIFTVGFYLIFFSRRFSINDESFGVFGVNETTQTDTAWQSIEDDNYLEFYEETTYGVVYMDSNGNLLYTLPNGDLYYAGSDEIIFQRIDDDLFIRNTDGAVFEIHYPDDIDHTRG